MKIVLPEDLFVELKQAYGQNTFRNMRLYQELNNLLILFQAENIPVILLKGAYLAIAVYDSVGLRTMGDIDLLVKREDMFRVDRELLACGYIPEMDNREITPETHHFRYSLDKNGFSVEVHWSFINEYRYSQIFDDSDGLWNRATPVILAKAPAFVFAPEDLLLHLCLHAALHMYLYRSKYEMRIRMLCDIGEVISHFGSNLDWQKLGVRAQQWGTVHPVYLVLRQAREFLKVHIPVDWLNSIKQGNSEEYFEFTTQLFFYHLDELNVVSKHQVLDNLWGLKQFSQKAKLVQERLLPSRQSMAALYSVSANSWRIYLFYPVRWMEAFANNWKIGWNLVRGDPKTRKGVERVNQLKELQKWLTSG